ncbi:MAG: 1-acyl-sn-glycerol-3-phosphate acyltransferase, partial [Pseudomonas sp.]|nr:1-acyl-sn-glycerol-3-phosphate acyltransferase [Pseudomonas sp.]
AALAYQAQQAVQKALFGPVPQNQPVPVRPAYAA